MKKNLKKHRLISMFIAVAVLLLVALLAKGLFLNPQNVASTLIGKSALPFSAKLLQGAPWIGKGDGQQIKLDDLKGKPVVLNFWASWCVSCREEALYFEEFWKRYQESGVIVIGVAIQDTPDAAMEFVKTYGKTYPIGLDESGRISIDYGVYGVPETFFIDAGGVIRHKETGPMSVQLLEEKLALIKQQGMP